MKKSIYSILFFINFLFFSVNSFSQKDIKNYFDEVIQGENLPMSNGKLYTNTYKTTDTNPFYQELYSKGSLLYKNESYGDISLKYDVFRDVLIFRPYGSSEKFGIELIIENVNSFTLKNKKFVNLSQQTNYSHSFIKGYYEENHKSDKLSFYIKHKKENIAFIKDKQIYSSFKNQNEYLLLSNSDFHKIRDVKDVIKLFPYLEKEIYQFEEEYVLLLKTNKDEFFEKLIKKVSTLIQ